ncbi:MAG: FAD-dependent oxidoreductase [Gammaproteobacteria bacterium]|nr:FAD-dependent oxidoreductase [Gammaproteobacteria bacterium]MCW8909854.1 FAD-dependent oxidoreductase [Gammaproteobacteria bacterium]
MVTDYDLLIIGAGIHGAACAQAASAKGYKVLVLEQFEKPGLVTSSKSSKLIHGGLRYLESGQFKLVRECLEERHYLLKNAPALVKLVPFHIPVYKNTFRSALIIRIGLIIYSLFSRKSFSSVPKRKWKDLDGLNTKNLKTVFKYYDAQTDDQKLTAAVMSSAEKLGAVLHTNTTFDKADCTNDVCTVDFTQNKTLKSITTKLIINTAGPWVNPVLKKIHPQPEALDIELVLGTHIIINGQLTRGIYYLEAPQDQRAVFAMPWKNKIMIGTTETLYNDTPEKVTSPEADINYLLDVYNTYFSQKKSISDIEESFSGLRILPKATGSAFSRPRDTIIHHDITKTPRVFTLYGGKLTAHRATAEQLMKTIQPFLPAATRDIDTRKIKLTD